MIIDRCCRSFTIVVYKDCVGFNPRGECCTRRAPSVNFLLTALRAVALFKYAFIYGTEENRSAVAPAS